MKLLAIFPKHSYGDPTREESYEYVHFYDSFIQMGLQVEHFDPLVLEKSMGREKMNEELLSTVQKTSPDICFFSLTGNEFSVATLEAIRGRTRRVGFFHDDTWRVDYTRHWAKYFDVFTTPNPNGPRNYERLGLSHSVFLPFGCNTKAFPRQRVEKKYDLSFIGAWHPHREYLINCLRKAGFQVEVGGFGWPKSNISHSEMVRIFNESRISLNLSNSTSWDLDYVLHSPRGLWNNLRSKKSVEQLKGRLFEVPACGSALLTYYVEGLEQLFKIGSEIAIFQNHRDLIEKVQELLEDQTYLSRLTDAGYQRVIQDHTYVRRFSDLLNIR